MQFEVAESGAEFMHSQIKIPRVGIEVETQACISSQGFVSLPVSEAEELATRFKALSDPNRLRILSIISNSLTGEVCVCDLPAPLNLRQSTVSHHLKILVDAGLLQREKRGVWVYYSLAPGAFESLAQMLTANWGDSSSTNNLNVLV